MKALLRLVPISGSFLSVLVLLPATGCIAHYGFSQGAFPPNIKSMAVLPFDNQTASPVISSELFEAMHAELQKRLGVRDAAQGHADAMVKGTVVSYDPDVPVSFSANPAQTVSARRRLRITLDVEIVDLTTGKTLWKKSGLSAEGEYAERAEQEGRRLAIKKIVDEIVEGA